MAVKSYQKDGLTQWAVYVNIRSKDDPSVRLQKKILNLKSEKEASSEEKKATRELYEKLNKLECRGLTWGEIIDRWEAAMMIPGAQDRVAMTTVEDYSSRLNRYTGSWLNRPSVEITKADGRKVLKELELTGRTRKFQKTVKDTVNTVFRWALEEGLIRGVHESPMKGLELTATKEEKVPEILTLEEIRKFLFDARRLDHPWYPIWAMALLTGMRSGELYALLWTDIDLENRKITVSKSYNTRVKGVKSTKSGHWRTVPISDELTELLLKLQAEAGGRASVLPHFGKWSSGDQASILRTFCTGIGVRSIRFHALRACFATQLLAHDVAPATVMKICGWEQLDTMQRYIRMAGIDERGATQVLKVLPSEEAMAKVVNLFEFKRG